MVAAKVLQFWQLMLDSSVLDLGKNRSAVFECMQCLVSVHHLNPFWLHLLCYLACIFLPPSPPPQVPSHPNYPTQLRYRTLYGHN